MKFLDLLMDVVVKAVVNLLACHLYQEWWGLFLFPFISLLFFLYGKINAGNGTAVCPSC
jgi:hypothetical protein